MCRWIAYQGAPIFLEELIFKPRHSLIDQSLAARSSETPTNGDGFGLGWYGEREIPGVYKDVRPAWNDANLLDLAAQIRSGLFLAHVRGASPGMSVQRANCHPFRYGRWLFMHNGVVRSFPHLRRDLAFAVAPELYPAIEGSTDSEVLFFLALTFGLERDAVPALERMAGLVEQVGERHGVEHPLEMTLGLADGRRLLAVRYSSQGPSRSLFHNTSRTAFHELHPELCHLAPGARLVVSEPLNDLTEEWEEIPESTVLVVEGGEVTQRPFQPRTEPA